MEFENISLKEGIRLSRDKQHYILMDVREEDRYKEGHLEDALSCPYGILKDCYEQMIGKKIIVYCDFGGQSMMAARHLRKDGFEVEEKRVELEGKGRRVCDQEVFHCRSERSEGSG